MEERLIMFIVISLIAIFVSYIVPFVHGSLIILSTIFASLASLLFFYKYEYPILKLFLFFFLSTLIFSIFINIFFPNIYKEIKEELKTDKEELGDKENLLKIIFFHNLSIYLQAFILSSFSIIGGFIFLFWNLLLFWLLIINSINPFLTFIILAPHGILEFFSFYLASVSGTKIFKNLIFKEEVTRDDLKMFLFGILILFIAALIEVFIILA